MSKRFYALLLALGFGWTYLPGLVFMVFDYKMSLPYVDDRGLRLFILVLLVSVETGNVAHKWLRRIGWLFVVLLGLGWVFFTMRWNGGEPLVYISSFLLLTLWVYRSVIEKNKGLLNYTLFAYFLVWALFYRRLEPQAIWWTKQVLGYLIFVLAALQLAGKEVFHGEEEQEDVLDNSLKE